MEINLAVVGLGRIGSMHAVHAKQVADETEGCRLRALVDQDLDKARRIAAELRGGGPEIAAFASVDDLIASGTANASVIATPTAMHHEHAEKLIRSGQRVLLEKPMTEHLSTDREFARLLDASYPDALMLAFQRRFDAPLQYARSLLEQGSIGRCFKIVSLLEDSGPAPRGYRSGGILKDMSVHNVDEVLWLTGRRPDHAASGGSAVYALKLVPESEDGYDDAFLQLWFGDDLIARIEVSRNHVSGYRIETWMFGTEGQIHVGRFEQNRHKVVVEAYGRREAIARKEFLMPAYGEGAPEFMDRFGPAYKEEIRTFVRCAAAGEPFPVGHKEGLRAMEIIDAAEKARWTRETAQPVRC